MSTAFIPLRLLRQFFNHVISLFGEQLINGSHLLSPQSQSTSFTELLDLALLSPNLEFATVLQVLSLQVQLQERSLKVIRDSP